MEIRKNFPFESCETCGECILDVDDQILFFNGDNYQRVITVGCKNENLCRRLKEKINHAERK